MTNYSKKEFKTLGKIEHTIIKLDETLGKMEDTDSKIKHFFEQEKAIHEIKKTLEFFGLDQEDESNQKRLRDLENGQCLMQDLYGRVGVVQVHPVFEELFHAFDTRPPVQERME